MKHLNYFENTNLAISPDERAFFAQLGMRIADLRKQHGITQTQLAETLEVSQQTVNSYEVARRRVPASALPTLANLFDVSIDELLGGQTKQATNKRGPASKMQKQLERVGSLPRSKQKFITEMLDALIQQQAS